MVFSHNKNLPGRNVSYKPGCVSSWRKTIEMERDKSALGGFILIAFFIFLILLLGQATKAQSGNFSEINGESGEAAIHIYDHHTLAICHNGHRWVEQIDSVSQDTVSTTYITGYAKWVIFWDRDESGLINRKRITSAECHQPIGDPIFYK